MKASEQIPLMIDPARTLLRQVDELTRLKLTTEGDDVALCREVFEMMRDTSRTIVTLLENASREETVVADHLRFDFKMIDSLISAFDFLQTTNTLTANPAHMAKLNDIMRQGEKLQRWYEAVCQEARDNR